MYFNQQCIKNGITPKISCADGINDYFLTCATQWMSKIKKKYDQLLQAKHVETVELEKNLIKLG